MTLQSLWHRIARRLGLRPAPTLRQRLLAAGARVGRGAFIGSDTLVDLDYAFLLDIGEGAVVSSRCIIELHDSCLPNVLGSGPMLIAPVVIGPRAYVGVGSVLLPGVTIGAGAIVGAGAVVTKDIPPGEVWAGVPARRIGDVASLSLKRQGGEAPGRGRLYPWIGEVEKLGIDYRTKKRELQAAVRRDFERN